MKTAVVLSGGGARGAYEAGVLHYVLEELPKSLGRPVRFDVVSGSSVGAVHACFLAAYSGEPGATANLADIWKSFEIGTALRVSGRDLAALPLKLLGYRPRSRPVAAEDPRAPVRIPGLLDVTAIEELILDRIAWDRIPEKIESGALDALAISATQIKSGRTVIFVQNRGGHVDPWAHDPYVVGVSAKIRPEHALASAAIPFFFPVMQVDGAFYCDGSLRLNTPLSPALRLGAERVLVIGVHHRARRGEEPPPIPEANIGNPAFLAGKILDALLLDRVDYDADRLRLFNAMLSEGRRCYGEGFLHRINEPVVARRGAPYRIVRECFLEPSEDLGRIAAECLAHLDPGKHPRPWLSKRFLKLISRNQGEEADLLSYLFFDGCYASHLIELGRADAAREHDRLVEFFS